MKEKTRTLTKREIKGLQKCIVKGQRKRKYVRPNNTSGLPDKKDISLFDLSDHKILLAEALVESEGPEFVKAYPEVVVAIIEHRMDIFDRTFKN